MTSQRDRLADILDIAAQLAEVIADGRAAYDASWRQQRLVEHLIELIGEAAANLPADYRARHPEVPWASAIATRNRLIHGYFDLNPARTWNTATQDIPPFVALIGRLHRQQSCDECVEEERATWGGTSPAPAIADARMLTPRQVADQLAVSTRTVYLWIDEGRLPAVRLSERVTRVPSQAVDALVAASTRPANPAPMLLTRYVVSDILSGS